MKNYKLIYSREFLDKIFKKSNHINRTEYEAFYKNFNKKLPEIFNILKTIHNEYLKSVYEKIFDPRFLKKYNYSLKDFYKEVNLGSFNASNIENRLNKVIDPNFDPKQDEFYRKYHHDSKYAKEHNKLYKPMALIYESSDSLYASSKFCNCLWWIRDEKGEITGRDKRFSSIEEVLLTDSHKWLELENADFRKLKDYYFSALMESIVFKFKQVVKEKYENEFKKYGEFLFLNDSDGEIKIFYMGFAPNFKLKD